MKNKIYAFIQMYNEYTNGHLQRCLDNCKEWADEIIIYDDGSTDKSVEIASGYTKHIIIGEPNILIRETFHKQMIMNYIHNMKVEPDWLLWIDCDEILDRHTIANLRQFCDDNHSVDIDGYAFQQINLWRGERYYRTDGVFYRKEYNEIYGWFVRLWKYQSNLEMHCEEGNDRRIYPINIQKIAGSDFKIIHYGFSDYKAVMRHIGIHKNTRKELIDVANGDIYVRLANEGHVWAKNYVINGKGVPNMFMNEQDLTTEYVPDDWFPVKNIPKIHYEKPMPIKWENLKAYNEL
jgi:glycosyltransferase involved in cell wall biosynthesis